MSSRPPPSQKLNPLAAAKGQKLLCELTGKPATIVVNYFGVPYNYTDRATLELDWNGIKEKIAQLLVPLRQPPSVIPSVEERERQEANVRKSKLALIDLCRMEATKFLVHGDFELSIPGAVQALRFSLDVYGAGKIELVPCYLLLAEANLGLGRHKQAEEYLSLANWSILKNPDCSNRTKSQLYRNFGKLYASQGKHEEALRQLANDVYFSSLQVGPEHIETAGGYYYLATVFYLQQRIDCALAMCDKVVDVWFKHISGLLDTRRLRPGQDAPEPLGESQLMDGLQTLTKIVALREESMGPEHITTGEALFTVSLVYWYAKDNQRSLQLMDKAYAIYCYELGRDNPRTLEVAESIEAAGGVVPDVESAPEAPPAAPAQAQEVAPAQAQEAAPAQAQEAAPAQEEPAAQGGEEGGAAAVVVSPQEGGGGDAPPDGGVDGVPGGGQADEGGGGETGEGEEEGGGGGGGGDEPAAPAPAEEGGEGGENSGGEPSSAAAADGEGDAKEEEEGAAGAAPEEGGDAAAAADEEKPAEDGEAAPGAGEGDAAPAPAEAESSAPAAEGGGEEGMPEEGGEEAGPEGSAEAQAEGGGGDEQAAGDGDAAAAADGGEAPPSAEESAPSAEGGGEEGEAAAAPAEPAAE